MEEIWPLSPSTDVSFWGQCAAPGDYSERRGRDQLKLTLPTCLSEPSRTDQMKGINPKDFTVAANRTVIKCKC